MRISALIALVAPLFLGVSCHESDRSISVSETRELTLFDHKYPGNIKDVPPLEWRRIPGTQMRILNYVAGPDDSVQIFLGQSGGGILPNGNRWLGQFGLPKVETVDAFQKIEALEQDAYLIEAKGDFGGGMGQEPKKNQGLIGFIRPSGEDVITLKMTGPADAVAAERDRFLAYSKALQFVAPQLLSESVEPSN
ncbi:MAG: hypothetical protein ACN4GG_05395 [Akkermansiaceae bacterium]